MTAKELKNSILQMAIEGKLVEQRNEEGSAEVLYAEIQKEKAKLIKEGKIKKEKPLPEITEEEIPFEIPKGWKWVRFGEIVNYHMGKTPPRAEKQWWGVGVPWVSIADMPENEHINQTKEYVTKEAISNKFNNRVSKKGTLLMSFKLTVGRVSILDIDAVHNEAIISIYPLCDKNNIIQKYLFYILPLITNWGDSKDAIKGKTLNDTSIRNLLVSLPPLEEQHRIVEKIEELMPLVDRYGELYDKLQKLNKEFLDKLLNAILKKAMEGKLTKQEKSDGDANDLYKEIQKEKLKLIKTGKIKKEKPLPEITDDEIPFEIPKNWKWCRLNNITYNAGNKNNQIKTVEIKKDGKYPVVSQGQNLIDGFCDDEKKLVKDIPLIMFGDHTRNVKYIDFNFIIGADGTKFLKAILVNPKYLYYWTKFSANKLKNRGYARHFSLLCEELFPLPPLQEQHRIVEKIEELMPLVDNFARLKQ